MPYRPRSLSRLVVVVLALAAACDPTVTPVPDAGPGDAGRSDAGPPVPASTAHCDYEPVPATGHAGGTVTAATLHAGAAEGPFSVPLGVTFGAYAARSPALGGAGFVDDRRTLLAGEFAPSVGIESAPMIHAVALSTGTAPDFEETILIVQVDLALFYQGLLFGLEERLGPEFAGKIIVSASHSHAAWANYTVDGMQTAFGGFRRTVYEAMLDDLETVCRAALAARRPAAIGIAHDPDFDLDDEVTRDRRGENDAVEYGLDDDQNLYVIRIDDATTDEPLALLPVFGMHGTVLGDENMLASGDAPGGVTLAIAELFDETSSGPVVVAHLQGAGGNVSPVGLERRPACPADGPLCDNFMRNESVGRRAAAEIMALYDEAGLDMRTTIELEMVTRSVEHGPDWENFTVRGGALRYAPMDAVTPCDGDIFDDMGRLISPIDEFNAPMGAALCADEGRVRAYNRGGQIAGTINAEGLPSTPELAASPYFTCNRLEGITNLLETALDVDFTGPPACETTRSLFSAVRIGDWYLATLPGDPLVSGVETLRAIAPVPGDHLIAIGYAQDYSAYIMTAEDWMTGGYEPTITFWGPLEGEAIVEGVAELLMAVTTAEREDTGTGGTHVAVPAIDESLVSDPAPMAGTIPSSAPAYVATRLLPMVPANADVPATARRLESVFFTWIGEDPLEGTPVVEIEHETPTGWEPIRRRSGRVVHSGEMIMTWTPDPLVTLSETEPQTHYWTVEWQVVPGATPDLADRFAAPLGNYRFVVTGPTYTVTSGVLVVQPADLVVTGTLAGADASLHVDVDAGMGFRLLDDQLGGTGMIPIRSTGVEATVTLSGGAVETRSGLTTDAAGDVVVTGVAGATSIELVDSAGNRGTVTF